MFASLSLCKFLSLSLHLFSRLPRVGFNARSTHKGATLMAAVNNCRLHEYQGGIKRFPVPEEKIPWQVDWPEYSPVDYTAPVVLDLPVWADPDFRLGSGS
jgi:ADP-ribose pyrophosphatase